MSIRVGVLLRHEDESGVSGTGLVADLVEYPDGWCVAHWRSNTPSTNIYPNCKAMEAVHSHGGKTEIVWFADLPSPKNEEEVANLAERFGLHEDEDREKMIEELAEEVAELMIKDEAERKPTRSSGKRVGARKKEPRAPEEEKEGEEE